MKWLQVLGMVNLRLNVRSANVWRTNNDTRVNVANLYLAPPFLTLFRWHISVRLLNVLCRRWLSRRYTNITAHVLGQWMNGNNCGKKRVKRDSVRTAHLKEVEVSTASKHRNIIDKHVKKERSKLKLCTEWIAMTQERR